jgi:hypothetical protein
MYWFSHVYQEMNNLYDSWLSSITKGEMSNYLAKIVNDGILLPDSRMQW